MTIQTRPFADLDTALVSAELNLATEAVQEENPSKHTQLGVIRDVLTFGHALFAAQLKTLLQDYLSARSLKQISADPTLADPDVVDDVLSNFLLTRQPGARASGNVTMVRDVNTPYTLAVGSVFTANGLSYTTTQLFSAKTNAAQISDSGDRLITKLSDGRYAFTITVEAQVEGIKYLLAKDTLVVPASPPPGYVTSFATDDFTGGIDVETNAELLSRLQQGIAAKAPSNRVNGAAMLRANTLFARVQALSIIGFGDQEMNRDKYWIWPQGGGGRADWYVRSEARVVKTVRTKSAVLIAKTTDLKGVWQFTVTRDEAPGFYEVDTIVLPENVGAATAGFAVTADSRGLDLTGAGFVPDVKNSDGVYSRYQTAVVEFLDTATDTLALPLGTRKDYLVTLKAMPLVADIQDWLNSRDIHAYGSDVLVKAAVPCFVQLTLTVHKSSDQADPDIDAIKEELAASVNSVGFSGVLFGSTLQGVVRGHLLDGQAAGDIDMFGRIRYPDGTMKYLRGSETLRVSEDAGATVSHRTVQFFTDQNEIAVSVVTSVPID